MINYLSERRGVKPLALLVVCASLAACGNSDQASPDATETDATETDATETDATETDATEQTEVADTAGSGALEVNIYSRELPYFQEIAEAIGETADELGYEVNVTWGRTDPALQFEQIENAITRQPDGLIVVPVDRDAPVPAILNATNAGIPVVTMANDLNTEGSEALLAFVGNRYEELGARKAAWIVEQLGGEGKVAVIHGIRGLDFTESQALGAAEEFAKHPGIEIVGPTYAGAFSADRGVELTENVLTAHPDLDAVYFDNDDLALGGIVAVERRGIAPGEIILVGTDGGAPALDAVAAGDLDFTISLCGFATGVRAVEIVVAYLETGEAPSETFVQAPSLEFTPDNIAENRPLTGTRDC